MSILTWAPQSDESDEGEDDLFDPHDPMEGEVLEDKPVVNIKPQSAVHPPKKRAPNPSELQDLSSDSRRVLDLATGLRQPHGDIIQLVRQELHDGLTEFRTDRGPVRGPELANALFGEDFPLVELSVDPSEQRDWLLRQVRHQVHLTGKPVRQFELSRVSGESTHARYDSGSSAEEITPREFDSESQLATLIGSSAEAGEVPIVIINPMLVTKNGLEFRRKIEMDQIIALVRSHGGFVIVDESESFGAGLRGAGKLFWSDKPDALFMNMELTHASTGGEMNDARLGITAVGPRLREKWQEANGSFIQTEPRARAALAVVRHVRKHLPPALQQARDICRILADAKRSGKIPGENLGTFLRCGRFVTLQLPDEVAAAWADLGTEEVHPIEFGRLNGPDSRYQRVVAPAITHANRAKTIGSQLVDVLG